MRSAPAAPTGCAATVRTAGRGLRKSARASWLLPQQAAIDRDDGPRLGLDGVLGLDMGAGGAACGGAAGLVGQSVTYKDDAGATITGTVSAVSYAGAVPTVKVGDKDVPLDSVASVAAPTAPATTPAATA